MNDEPKVRWIARLRVDHEDILDLLDQYHETASLLSALAGEQYGYDENGVWQLANDGTQYDGGLEDLAQHVVDRLRSAKALSPESEAP